MTADSYPHQLAGDPAPPPAPAPARVLGMALKAHARYLQALDDDGEARWSASLWRLAGAVEQLRAEADQAAPSRNKASDGTIGDARHMEAGTGSDHNPWLKVGSVGIVRALDLTNDPVLDLPAVFERLRVRAAAGECPQLTGGGYLILNGRITAPDFGGWRAYTGADPHVSHGHVSVSRDAARFDARTPWGAFRSEQPTPAPVPAPSSSTEWTGPDLIGSGTSLRGQAAGQPSGAQSNGPRVAALQAFLNRTYPAYSDLAVDGWYGEATAGVLRQFAARSGIAGADGLNIGPLLAAALTKAGFERTVSSARARVLSHVGRRGRR